MRQVAVKTKLGLNAKAGGPLGGGLAWKGEMSLLFAAIFYFKPLNFIFNSGDHSVISFLEQVQIFKVWINVKFVLRVTHIPYFFLPAAEIHAINQKYWFTLLYIRYESLKIRHPKTGGFGLNGMTASTLKPQVATLYDYLNCKRALRRSRTNHLLLYMHVRTTCTTVGKFIPPNQVPRGLGWWVASALLIGPNSNSGSQWEWRTRTTVLEGRQSYCMWRGICKRLAYLKFLCFCYEHPF